RTRVRLQVEYGMDARHARLLRAGPDLPPVPPPRADVLDDLRVHRELHPAALARRGRPRKGVAAREDAGRPLAAAGEPARALRVYVGAPGEEAPLHGRRAGAGGRVEPQRLARLVSARPARARRHPAARPRPEPGLPQRARALRGRLRATGVPLA